MFDVVLFEPEIPPNTGNIIRLCANTGARLHLIRTAGVPVGRPVVAAGRAGLSRMGYGAVASRSGRLSRRGDRPAVRFTTKGARPYHTVAYQPDDALLFGPETRGLPGQLLADLAPEQRLRIPMRTEARSLNLSNAVAIVVYEAWRQCGFQVSNLGTSHE
jgi:tRNA (cytidine/uridine-2'-O-)-methyltransferase